MPRKNWDFTEEDTKISTHGFHTYPATMIPQVAQNLIKTYSGRTPNLLFDPYCGSGTSLVEANIQGINAIGTDINPLARLITQAKTTIIEQQTIDLYLKEFYDYLFPFRLGFNKKESIIAPQFNNIDYWFTKSVKTDLAVVKNFIININDDAIKNFFKVAFSQTIRECSLTRKDEFKLYRMSKDKMKTFKPDVFSTLERVLKKNRDGLLQLAATKNNVSRSIICDFNTVQIIPNEIIEARSVDIVVTSPPYGDSPTTVAYGQFSRLANQWLDNADANHVDSSLMGGKKTEAIEKFGNRSLDAQIRFIMNQDEKRALDVVSFYKDYYYSIKNVSTTIRRGGYACYVVSNRCVKGITLKTDKITKDFFEDNGFVHKATYERKISSKRMPRHNSPSGIAGDVKPLMNKEYIVIMKKR